MKTPSSAGVNAAIQRQEDVVDYLREQLLDAENGESLRNAGELHRELDLAEAKLKRLQSGRCRPGANA